MIIELLITYLWEIILRRDDLSTTTQHTLSYKCANSISIFFYIIAYIFNIISIQFAYILTGVIGIAVFTSIAVWDGSLKFKYRKYVWRINGENDNSVWNTDSVSRFFFMVLLRVGFIYKIPVCSYFFSS